MSSHWQQVLLGEICTKVTDGSHNPPKGIEVSNFMMLSSKNVLDDQITLSAPRFLSESDFISENKRTEVQSGDVLLTIVGTVGRAAVVPQNFGNFTLQRSVAVLKPIPDLVDSRFLMFALQHRVAALQAQSQGVAQKGIYLKALKALRFALPPLEEQKRIVAVLDQTFAALDRARAMAEANLADAEELFEQELAYTFASTSNSIKARSFEKLCKALTPKTKIKRQDYLEQGYHPIVSQEADLISGYWNDEGALLGLEKPVVVFGDHTRCLKYVDFDFVVGADGTKVLQPAADVDPLYLYYGLRSIPIAEKGYARHFRFLKEASLPDLGEADQRRLAARLRKIETKALELADGYKAKLDDLDDLRQSLLQKAFAGALT